jgi:hypothetical protein
LQLFEHPQGAEGAGADAVVEVEHGGGLVSLAGCHFPQLSVRLVAAGNGYLISVHLIR